MKLIICLCAIVAALSAAKEMIPLAPESQEKLHNIAIPCAKEFNVDPSFVRKVGDPELFPRTEANNKFIHCFGVNSGILHADGHMNAEKLTGILGDHPFVGKVREAIKTCNGITKQDVVATAIAMHDCYGEQFPLRYVF